MRDEDMKIKKRFEELAERAEARHCLVYSEFLTLAEQSLLSEARLTVPVTFMGGYDNAERCVACFGDTASYDIEAHIVCIEVCPASQKFADDLTHRDFLGAIMNLGIRREVTGDIIIHENKGYIFCLESVADFISEQLTTVKHTTVRCRITDKLPTDSEPKSELVELIVPSERLDAVTAAVYKLSRNESQQLFVQKKVFVNSRVTENDSFRPNEGDIISVRGFGRFIYNGIERKTKKERLRISVSKF